MKTARARSTSSFDKKFSRYAAAAAASAASVATTSQADFSSPYQLTPPAAGNYTDNAVSQTFGAWTGSFTGTAPATSPFINTTNAPSSLSLGTTQNRDSAGQSRQVDLTTPIQFAGSLSFDWNFTANAPSQFGYTINNIFTSLSTGTGSGSFSVGVVPGAIFGFRTIASYLGATNLVSVTISNFSGPVPEPSIAMLAVSGAIALMLLREVRRRRQARA
jgi:hypothetical protein